MTSQGPAWRLAFSRAQSLQLWLRPLLVVGLLLLSATLALMASHRQLTLALYLLLSVSLVVAFLRWPPLGLIVASASGLIVPFLGPSGLNATMILVALLLGLWLLDMVVRQRHLRLASSRATWPLLAFVAAAMLSFGIGQLSWFTFAPHAPLGAQLGGFSILLLSAGTFLLGANQVRDLGGLSRITWAFLAVGGLSFLMSSVIPELGLATNDWFQRAGSLFLIWLVALAFSQAAFNRALHSGWRLALGGLVVVIVFTRLFLQFDDKGGWIPVLVCIGAIIGFRSWRVGLVLIPVGALVAWNLVSGRIGSEAYSLSTRIDAWLIMAQIIRVSPIWGLGFANYYWYTPLYPIRGYAVSFNSHNNYVDIVAETGLVGLVCFLWFLWELGRLGWRLRERVPAGFARAYVYGAWGGLIGTVVAGVFGDWVLPFFYNIGLSGFRTSMLGWLFLGGLVSLEQVTKSSRSRT